MPSPFDVKEYRDAKQRIVALIKESLPEWQTTQGFIMDGLIDPERYAETSPRVLCVFSESYGWAEIAVEHGGLPEIEDQKGWLDGTGYDLLSIPNSKVRLTRRILSALSLLYESLEAGQAVPYEQFVKRRQFRRSKEADRTLQDTVRKIGWINAKKASRRKGTGTKENFWEVYWAARNGSEILKQQLESIQPELLIICSNPANDALCDAGLLGEGIDKKAKNRVQINSDGMRVIRLDHPSTWWSYKKTYQQFKRMYAGMTINHRASR